MTAGLHKQRSVSLFEEAARGGIALPEVARGYLMFSKEHVWGLREKLLFLAAAGTS